MRGCCCCRQCRADANVGVVWLLGKLCTFSNRTIHYIYSRSFVMCCIVPALAGQLRGFPMTLVTSSNSPTDRQAGTPTEVEASICCIFPALHGPCSRQCGCKASRHMSEKTLPDSTARGRMRRKWALPRR